MCKKYTMIPLIAHTDERGSLVEVMRQDLLDGQQLGQLYYSTTHAGFTRGNHYHLRKEEWFCVLSGAMLLRLVDLDTGETHEATLTGDKPVIVKVYPRCLHSLTNVGSGDAVLLVRSSEPFVPSDPDTYTGQWCKSGGKE